MTAFALMVGAPEYFVLGIAALALISIASRGETIRGLIMGCMALLLGMVGPDPVSGVTYRFSFGIAALELVSTSHWAHWPFLHYCSW